ncbi:hypothetical protein M513_02498 [Trichuris suis]|uniref:Uncharacterized protein n=1 Tax=Trichuris suis TaxID=68888 RepID=A0A085MHX5_9BILA|nr:hypothetical protein M513_02498 [Trichuris suis]
MTTDEEKRFGEKDDSHGSDSNNLSYIIQLANRLRFEEVEYQDVGDISTRQQDWVTAEELQGKQKEEKNPETPASLKTSPEDVDRTSELDDTAKPGCDRTVQDTLWFEGVTNAPRSVGVTFVIPNPWMQQISTASHMDVLDGNSRKWSTFIANFRPLIHETVESDVQRLAILGQLLSPKLRSGFSGLIASQSMHRELQRLHKLYGDPKTVTKTNLNDLMSLPSLRSEQCGDLETFFCKVSGPVGTTKLCGLVHDLKSSALLEHTASKLTPRLDERWLSYERVSLL